MDWTVRLTLGLFLLSMFLLVMFALLALLLRVLTAMRNRLSNARRSEPTVGVEEQGTGGRRGGGQS